MVSDAEKCADFSGKILIPKFQKYSDINLQRIPPALFI